MALVGHISGSIQSNSVIGVSGSVIIADRPNATFPALPGTDVKLYVEGLSLFGSSGLTSSGSLAVKDATGTSKFSVASSTGNTLVGGTLGVISDLSVATSKFNVTAATGNTTVGGTLNVNSSITGSSSLTVGSDVVTTSATQNIFTTTASTINFGTVAATGNVMTGQALGAGTKQLNLATGATGSTTTVTVGSSSGANNSITLGGGTGTTTVTLGGGPGNNTINIGTTAGTSTVSIGGLIGTTTFNGNVAASKNVTITGDLTVNGTMTTVNTTNLEVKDNVIGLGFSSGTIAVTNGDRGWIGSNVTAGIDTHVMNKWDNTASEFVFARTTSSATGSFGISSYSNLHAANIQGSIISASLGFSGSLTKLLDGTSAFIGGSGISVTSASNGAVTISATSSGGSGDSAASYLVLSTTSSLSNERAFVAGTGLSAVDGGANGNYTLAINDSVVATISGSTFDGVVKFNAGLSGSLTKLTDGTSYLIAGSNITIVTGSNGAVTIGTSGLGTGDVTGPGSSTQYAVALFNDTSGKVIRNSALTTDGNNSLWIGNTLNVSGSTTFGASAVPSADMLYNLGSPSARWANVYTGDLHLRNERGDYTLIEEEDFLTIRFNKTGKRYKFVLEAVPELDEPADDTKTKSATKPAAKKAKAKK